MGLVVSSEGMLANTIQEFHVPGEMGVSSSFRRSRVDRDDLLRKDLNEDLGVI